MSSANNGSKHNKTQNFINQKNNKKMKGAALIQTDRKMFVMVLGEAHLNDNELGEHLK